MTIKEMQMKLKDWWTPLALREKQALILFASVVSLAIIYFGIWSPFLTQINTMRERIVTDQKTLLWMQATDKEIRKVDNQSKPSHKLQSPVALISILQKKIKSAGLSKSLSQLKQAGHDSIEMHFQKVEFDSFLKLFLEVIKEQKLSVTQLSVTAENAPGVVNVDLVLKI